jgi:hypothetical protein
VKHPPPSFCPLRCPHFASIPEYEIHEPYSSGYAPQGLTLRVLYRVLEKNYTLFASPAYPNRGRLGGDKVTRTFPAGS